MELELGDEAVIVTRYSACFYGGLDAAWHSAEVKVTQSNWIMSGRLGRWIVVLLLFGSNYADGEGISSGLGGGLGVFST